MQPHVDSGGANPKGILELARFPEGERGRCDFELVANPGYQQLGAWWQRSLLRPDDPYQLIWGWVGLVSRRA